MFTAQQDLKLRSTLRKGAKRKGLKPLHARRLERIADNDQLLGHFKGLMYKRYVREVGAAKAAAGGDGAFLEWLIEFINSGALEKLIAAIMSIVSLFIALALMLVQQGFEKGLLSLFI